MQNKTPFQNPYLEQIASGKVTRLTTDISTIDYTLVKCTRVGLGTITITINILWKKLCDELRQRGITDATHTEEYEQFITNLKLVPGNEYANFTRQSQLGDGSTGRVANETTRPILPRGVETTRSKPTKKKNVSPVVQSGSTKERRGQGRK